MTPKEAEQYLKDSGFKGGPENIKVGDKINGDEIIGITNLVDGKPTYASSFKCKVKENHEQA